MRSPSETPAARVRRGAPLVAAALLASACAGPARVPAAPLELADGQGFTVAEKVRAGSAARADFAGALRLLERERHEEGIAMLLRVTEAAPDATAAHIDLAIAYGRVGELAKAEASLARALELNPRHPVAHNELGIVYRRTGRFREARASYERALALQPGFHFAHRNLAILCDLYLADPACALEHYEAYARAVPDDATAAIWVGDLRSRAGR
jgi:tetratricopeptide (TPR) repeat protein